MSESPEPPLSSRIVNIILDDSAISGHGPDIEHERHVAIFDILENNHFHLLEGGEGPYVIRLAIEENRIILDVGAEDETALGRVTIPMTPFRSIIRDYFLVLESYFEAIKQASPSRIEAIDMGRRGLHNEGSELLMERLGEQVETDLDTARRLFTLVCALRRRF